MADESGSFEVNGRRYTLPSDLTMGEMCDAERYFGVEFGETLGTGSSMRMVSALMWIAIAREDPSVTIQDVRDLPASVFESFIAAGDAAVPPPEEKSGESEPSGQPSDATGDDLEELLAATGSPGSGIGSDSDLLTSKT